MLGVAFSQAQRSQELVMKLHQQKLNAQHQHQLHQQQQHQGQASVGAGSNNSGTSGGGHKRTRRRRRTKKPPGGMWIQGQQPRPPNKQHSQLSGNAMPKKLGKGHTTRPKQHDTPMTKRDLYVALRCGMVTTNGAGGRDHAVGRVTLVNWDNQLVLDTFVKVPPEIVVDYRTEVTGINAELLAMTSALRFDVARSKVGNLIRGKILIGHGLEVDLHALGLHHPWCDVRDTATYAPFMKKVSDPLSCMMLPRELNELMHFVFQRGVNLDQPTLVREAVGCLELYKHTRSVWEKELVHIMQTKERQREMMLNMRASGSQTLSSIKEDGGVDLANASAVAGSVTSSGHHLSYPVSDYDCEYDYDYDNSTLASSTMASTDPTTTANSVGSAYFDQRADDLSDTSNFDQRADDLSDASSFYTAETESSSNAFFHSRQARLETIPAHIENLSQLSSFEHIRQEDLHVGPGSGTAHGSQCFCGSGTEESIGNPDMWSHSLPASSKNSVNSADWSRGSSSPPNPALVNSVSLPQHPQQEHDIPSLAGLSLNTPPPVPLREEEPQGHLPTNLLADMDDDERAPTLFSNMLQGEAERSTFALLGQQPAPQTDDVGAVRAPPGFGS